MKPTLFPDPPAKSRRFPGLLRVVVCLLSGLALPLPAQQPSPATPAPAAPPAAPPTPCEEITAKVLKPARDKLATAEAALREWEEHNREAIRKMQERIKLLEGTAAEFAAAKQAKDKQLGDRLRWGREALGEAAADAVRRIAEKQREAAEWRAKGRQDRARGTEDSAAGIQRQVAAETYEWRKAELGYANTIKGWKDHVAATEKEQREFAQLFGKGDYGIPVRALGYGATWKQVQDMIALVRKSIEQAEKGEPGYHLRTLGYAMTRQQAVEYGKRLRDELRLVEANIVNGRFAVDVPALGRRADRNEVQRLIAEAGERRWRAARAFAEGKYVDPKSRAGKASNGELARQYALLTGKLRAAAPAEHERLMAQIADNEAAKADLQQRCVEAQQRETNEIKGRLQQALDQTPCAGGSNPPYEENFAHVKEHHRKLDLLSENGDEFERRLIDYFDRVFMEPEGTVHGDPQNAWAYAMREEIGQLPGRSIADILVGLKDLSDWICGLRDANDLQEANDAISEFLSLVKNLDPERLDAAELEKSRAAIRAHISKLDTMLSSGIFDEDRVRAYEAAIRKSVTDPDQLREQLKRLGQLRDTAHDARWAFKEQGCLGRFGASLARDMKAGYSAFVQGSARDLFKRLKDANKNMTGLEKGLLAITVIGAGAEAFQRMEEGMAPSEAIARSSVDLAIDLAVGGIPLLAAGEIAAQVTFGTWERVTGQQGVGEDLPSQWIKWIAQQSLDQVAAAAADSGEYYSNLERMVTNPPSIEQLVANVDMTRVRESLERVEARLAAIAPRHPLDFKDEEARLLRSRAAFRRLLRADAEIRRSGGR